MNSPLGESQGGGGQGGGHVGRITALPEMSHRTGRMLCPHRITAWYYRVYVERKYLLSGCLSNY